MTETVSQALVCKSKAAEFLKEREILNDAAATTWCKDYAVIELNKVKGKMEFWCWTRRTYRSGEIEYIGVYITESTDRYNKITDNLKTVWKDIKKEDENENDTITALILGLVRLESLGEMENNYLDIHETFVSPEQYDIEAKRYSRSRMLGNRKDYGYNPNMPFVCKTLEIFIEENDDPNHYNRLANICYLIIVPSG